MKDLFFRSLAVSLSFAVLVCFQVSAYNDDIYGDVNKDREVNIADVNAVIDVILGNPVTPPGQNKTFTVNGVTFSMMKVDGGAFIMGADDDDAEARPDERPARMVQLSDYYIGQTEVTQGLWNAVMGNNPSAFNGSQKPVERVTWEECVEFIQRLNALTGERFRLPTEAEWEFAARGGNFSNGYKYAGSNNINEVAWWGFENGGNNVNYTTQPVAQLLPNELGLYDMSGNVFEWCNDWYGKYPGPILYVNTPTLFLEDISAGQTQTTGMITVHGYHLSDDVYVSVNGDGFSVDPQIISASDANNNEIAINVTYTGPRTDYASAVITLKSKDALDVTVNVYYHRPELEVFADNPLKLQDVTIDGDTVQAATMIIIGRNLSNDIILSIDGSDFSVSPDVISPIDGKVDNAIVTVVYTGSDSLMVSRTITISCYGLPDQFVNVVANASDGEPVNLNQIGMIQSNDDYQGYVDVDPLGPSYGIYKIARGGSWNVEARFCRVSYRYNNKPDFKHFSIGLRLAL